MLGLGLALACDRYHPPTPDGVAGAAGAADLGNGGTSGGGGEGGAPASAGSSGNAGATQTTTGGTGGAGGSQDIPYPEECPDDGTDTAQLTFAGLGIALPGSEPTPDAGAAAGDAGTGDAGADGGTGEGSVDASVPNVLLPGLEGWASVTGMGSTSTTGGAAGRVVTATTAEQLQAYAGSDEPLVIRVCGTIQAPSVQVASNKTIVGVGAQGTLLGGLRIRGTPGAYVSNVVVKNLRVNGAQSAVDGAGIQIYDAHHVWIDHVEVFDSIDGLIQVVHGSDYVTVSWTKFHFTPATPDVEHRFACLIGHADDNATEDADHLQVTLHHNWWSDYIRQRAPRVRFGDVHLFENYYSQTGNDWSIWAAVGSRLRIEHNYFDHVATPHELHDADAQIQAIGNVYDTTTGIIASNGTAFTPPYAYTLGASVEDVPDAVMAGAGRQ